MSGISPGPNSRDFPPFVFPWISNTVRLIHKEGRPGHCGHRGTVTIFRNLNHGNPRWRHQLMPREFPVSLRINKRIDHTVFILSEGVPTQQAHARGIHVGYEWLCHVEYKRETGWMRKHVSRVYITCFPRGNATLNTCEHLFSTC